MELSQHLPVIAGPARRFFDVPVAHHPGNEVRNDGSLDQQAEEIVTAGPNAEGVPGTSIYLTEGEQLTMRDMLYGLMLRSGNDAAVAIAEHMVFDERLQAAKHLIDECIIDWSQGSRDEIKVLVQSAFQTDKEGKINTGRVLALRRLDIRDEKWQKAMQAIGESLQVVGSKEYVRFYERIGNTDQYQPISLDVAAV